MQAVHCLNTVTVPMGNQMGTDSGPGKGLVTIRWGVIYDHKQQILYLRSEMNQSLQRVQLADIKLGKGAASLRLQATTCCGLLTQAAEAAGCPASPGQLAT